MPSCQTKPFGRWILPVSNDKSAWVKLGIEVAELVSGDGVAVPTVVVEGTIVWVAVTVACILRSGSAKLCDVAKNSRIKLIDMIVV